MHELARRRDVASCTMWVIPEARPVHDIALQLLGLVAAIGAGLSCTTKATNTSDGERPFMSSDRMQSRLSRMSGAQECLVPLVVVPHQLCGGGFVRGRRRRVHVRLRVGSGTALRSNLGHGMNGVG